MATEKIRDWFIEFINRFREKSEELSKDDYKWIMGMENLFSPLQIHIFWFRNEYRKINLQIVLFTKWIDIPDLEIKIYGPIKFSESVEQAENILNESLWNRELPLRKHFYRKGGIMKYSEELENLFYNTFNNFKNSSLSWVFNDTDDLFSIQKSSMSSIECFSWKIYGDISSSPIDKEIDRIYKFLDQKNQQQAVKKEVKPKREIKGYGCYIFPPIWLGEQPKMTLKDKLLGTRILSFNKESLIQNYKGRTLILEKDGFIGIGEENKEQALTLLNEIMAIANIYKYTLHIIQNRDLGNIVINMESSRITSSSFSGTTKRTILSDERWKDIREIRIWARESIPIEQIKKIIKMAEAILSEDINSNIIIIFLGALTHLYNHEFSMSFLMNWTLIEKKIEIEWNKMLENNTNDINHKNKLRKRKFHTLDDKIEILYLKKIIKDNKYLELIRLKKIRNDIVHKGKKAKKEDVEACIIINHLSIKEIIKKLTT